MSKQYFTVTVSTSGTRTYIEIPFDPNETWGEKQRHYVTGSVNGHTIRGPLDSDGSRYVLPLGPAWLQGRDVDTATPVEVELAPEGPQTDNMAPDIVAALAAEPQARSFFESLATFYRKNYVRWIEAAKRPETRSARIAEMISLLKAGTRQR